MIAINKRKSVVRLSSFAALFLTGCAMQSSLFNVQPERAGFVITRPPTQISYRGDISKEGQEFALRVLRQMQKDTANDYRFNENTNVRQNSIDGKSDSVNVTLIESTHAQKDEQESE